MFMVTVVPSLGGISLKGRYERMVGGKDRQTYVRGTGFRQFLEKCMQLPDSVGWGAVKGEIAVFEGCVSTDHQYLQRQGREADRKTANSHPAIPVVAVSTGRVHWLCVISCLVCEPSSKDIHVIYLRPIHGIQPCVLLPTTWPVIQ